MKHIPRLQFKPEQKFHTLRLFYTTLYIIILSWIASISCKNEATT